MDLHIYHHFSNDPQQEAQLARIITLLGQMKVTIMSELDILVANVAANTTVIQSAIALINGIAARIDAAGVDPAKLSALSTSLKTDDDELAASVLANTQVAPPVAVTPSA